MQGDILWQGGHEAAAPALPTRISQDAQQNLMLWLFLQNIEDRRKLLKQTQEEGTAPVHSYWRKGLKGRPVCISNGLLWNIEAPSGLAFHVTNGPFFMICQSMNAQHSLTGKPCFWLYARAPGPLHCIQQVQPLCLLAHPLMGMTVCE